MIARDNSQPFPASISDWSDVAGLQAKMVEAVEALERMADSVGSARHIQTYDSDRRKMALSRAMSPALAGGDSVSKAEAEARASLPYAKEIEVLAKQCEAAEQAVAKWDAAKLIWSTAQSLLSFQKETVKHL